MYLIITSHIYIYCHVFTAQPPFSPLHNPGVPQHFESHRRLDGVEQRLQVPMENGCEHFALILVCKGKNLNLKSACSSSRHKDVPGGENPKFWATQAWRQKDTGHDAISLNHSEPTSQPALLISPLSAPGWDIWHLQTSKEIQRTGMTGRMQCKYARLQTSPVQMTTSRI